MITYIPPRVLSEVNRVFEYGAQKYSADNWKEVPIQKFEASFERHWGAYKIGNELDESGLHHLAHAISNLMIIYEKEYSDENSN